MPASKKIFHAQDLQGNRIKNVGAPSDNTDVATKASAQAQADAAKLAAEATASSLASAAQAAAISAAATDATSKASAAQSAAISAAATDATSKASAAQAAAISVAATDATSKASSALTSANTYTDGKITALVGTAPATLDTLQEIAAAISSGETATGAIVTSLATKTTLVKVDITGSGTSGADGVEYTVSHNLNKANVLVQAFEGNDQVDVFIRKVDNDSLKIITGSALGGTTLSVVVVG